ncbi:hypothetical protein DICPUDRAFT_147778 [Dictyostelium purpureum]|uniref:Uncharacterized protein n=1 Tax=Dictyostelium purpureum TaxID=5786 RepID=F0Z9D9_DICPU|nr:uncharacterized protein DICPUDRAFT_147778 [Dictyostelium purpureum]EGC39480.1 hypothetical protein DICPUDRAFT_147778 [Dictyostelium purpureum]|eukprot:XP_003284038.1 hypothetical protein DICPUDRAFT_147778 [Dictyostelium purpureum]
MITRLFNNNNKLVLNNINRVMVQKSYYSTNDEIRLKTKIPIFRHDDQGDCISIGKLKESEHSVALVNLEFLKIDSIVNLTQEELSRLVVIPKTEKLSTDQRIEKLESDIKSIKESLDKLTPKRNTQL